MAGMTAQPHFQDQALTWPETQLTAWNQSQQYISSILISELVEAPFCHHNTAVKPGQRPINLPEPKHNNLTEEFFNFVYLQWQNPGLTRSRLIIYTRKPDAVLMFLTHLSLTHHPISGVYQSSTAMLIFYKNYLSARNLVEKRSFPEFVRTFVFTHSHTDNAEIIINV